MTPPTRQSVRLRVNGTVVDEVVEPRLHLADFLREHLLLTGTHIGCEHGVCGACTVLIDGAPARSCITYAVACQDSDVRTVEGFDDDPLMGALREAFSAHHALQCGYCTPGMLVTAYDIVRRLPGVDEARIRTELGGNLCRCTGYHGVVAAIAAVLASPSPAAATAGAETAPAEVGVLPGPLPRAAAAGAAADDPVPPAGGSGDGAGLERRQSIALAPDRLWAQLHDVEGMVACLPGAELVERHGDDLRLRLAVGIGPMRARFTGRAQVRYDEGQRRGVLAVDAEDARTRTRGTGSITFGVQDAPGDPEAAELALALDYALKGPLAQFSRGAVVEAVVDQLLARFGANLEATAAGRPPASTQAHGGAFRVLWGRLRTWLGG